MGNRVGDGPAAQFRPRIWLHRPDPGSPLVFPLAVNWAHCDRSDYRIAEEYSENLLHCLPEGGAVFPLANNETFLLAYQMFVEGDERARLLDRRSVGSRVTNRGQ